MLKNWYKIPVSKKELHLKPTLSGGQSFRWKSIKANEWIGVFRNYVWMLYQSDDYLYFKCINKPSQPNGNSSELSNIQAEKLLKNYFRLDINLSNFYKKWIKADSNFKKAAPRMYGIRMLNQEIAENLFSFICSSNNNIQRISSMVEKLCEFYGELIVEIDGKKFYTFPETHNLAQSSVESTLRKAGFGYRAKFIYKSACLIEELGGNKWLQKLKNLPYEVAKKELMRLPGIGAKVADCICLMSLGHMQAIPVDTHIFKITSDIYLPHLKKYKNLNTTVYNEIGDYFRNLHGSYAGWANTVLFCSDLKILKSLIKDKNSPENEGMVQN